jgi:hypothetical protein
MTGSNKQTFSQTTQKPLWSISRGVGPGVFMNAEATELSLKCQKFKINYNLSSGFF